MSMQLSKRSTPIVKCNKIAGVCNKMMFTKHRVSLQSERFVYWYIPYSCCTSFSALLNVGEATPEVLCPVVGCSVPESPGHTGPTSALELLQGLGHLCCEERPREPGLLSLGMRRAGESRPCPPSPAGRCREAGARLCSVVPRARPRGPGPSLDGCWAPSLSRGLDQVAFRGAFQPQPCRDSGSAIRQVMPAVTCSMGGITSGLLSSTLTGS